MGHQYGRGLMISGPGNSQPSKQICDNGCVNKEIHRDWFLASLSSRNNDLKCESY
jgi:hypothetical protein